MICANCKNFQPSKYNSKQGAGMCGVLIAWYDKHREANKKPNPTAVKNVYHNLGGKFGEASAICWPKSERDGCRRFVNKQT